jgi:hypothetical protein
MYIRSIPEISYDILLGDFNAKAGREDILKLTTVMINEELLARKVAAAV